MEAGSATSSGLGWRLWAVVPILLLALAVGAFVSAGDRLLDLVGDSPPPADELEIRRVEIRAVQIRVRHARDLLERVGHHVGRRVGANLEQLVCGRTGLCEHPLRPQ